MAAILAAPALESVARANGLRVLDWAIQLLNHRTGAAFDEAAVEALRKGSKTLAFNVSAPPRLWSEGSSVPPGSGGPSFDGGRSR